MRIVRIGNGGEATSGEAEFGAAFVGTAWCVVRDRYLVTAHHVLNEGAARDAGDRFYVFSVPGNGATAFAFPVTRFVLEDQANDYAILEIGPCLEPGNHIEPAAVTFDRPPDGSAVISCGFPSPIISGCNVTGTGEFLGGGIFFLKAHANEGIVAAQYDVDGVWHYEFNVGWHHGESGGPVFRQEPLAAFAGMQYYRNIQAPHGVMAGPRCGRELATIRDALVGIGVREV